MTLINTDNSLNNDSFDLLSDVEQWYEEPQQLDNWVSAFSWMSTSNSLQDLEDFLSTPSPNYSLNKYSEDKSDLNAKRCLLYEFENMEKHHKEPRSNKHFVSALSWPSMPDSLYDLEDFLSIDSPNCTAVNTNSYSEDESPHAKRCLQGDFEILDYDAHSSTLDSVDALNLDDMTNFCMYTSLVKNARFCDSDTPFKVLTCNLEEVESERNLFTSTLDSIPMLDVQNYDDLINLEYESNSLVYCEDLLNLSFSSV